jgi:TP901 family phage tail tape measure protein
MQIADLFYSVRGEGFDQLEKQINKNIKKLAGFGAAFSAGITTPILAMGTGIIDTTMTFDKEMSKTKAITGETGKGFDDLRDLALEMGSSTSKSATEAAEAISYMGLAGWDLTQIQEGLEPILRASEAGMMDLGITSDLVTDSMSALGIGTEDLGRYLDIAAKAQNTSNQSMEQFLNAMVTAGGTFKMFNIPLEESGALLGILANRGFKGSEAGNALTSIFANLTSGSGQAGKAMKDLNIDIYDSQGKFRGATTILKELNKKFDGMTEAQRNTYIQMIGGKTRTKELNAMLNGTKEELDEVTDGLYNSDGALSDMAKTMQDNFAGQITSIKSKLEGIAISIGDRLTPYLKIAAEWVQKLADWFYQLSNPIKDAIIVIGLIAAGIGPLLLAFAAVSTVIIGFVTAIGTISVPVISIIALIGLAVTAFTIFTGGIIAAYAKMGILQWAFENIKAIVMAIVSIFQGDLNQAFNLLTEKFGMNREQANLFIERIIGARDAILRIIEVVKNVTKLLGAIFTADKQEMIDLLRKKFGFTKDEAKKFADKVEELRDKIIRVGEKMKEIATKAIAKFADMIKKAAQFVVDHKKEIALFIEKIIEMALFVGKLAKTVYDKFKDIKNNIKTAMEIGKTAIDKVADAFDSVKGAIGKVLDILAKLKFPSPPKWLTDKIPGFADGVRNFAGGWAMVGEQGPELMHVPKGSDIYSATRTRSILNNMTPSKMVTSNNRQENVNLYGDIVIDAKSVEEFNDIISVLKNVKHYKNMQ